MPAAAADDAAALGVTDGVGSGDGEATLGATDGSGLGAALAAGDEVPAHDVNTSAAMASKPAYPARGKPNPPIDPSLE
jgi:hypothetical protein